MVVWIDQGRTNYGIKLKICGTMFLHPKKILITTISIRL